MRSLFIFLLLSVFSLNGQELKGSLEDAATGEPIMNATVYFDGTSIGTISDLDGNFSLKKPEGLSVDLIISMVSYEKIRIKNPSSANLFNLKLTKKTNVLNEVVLELDPWSREKKERYFKEQFLGSVPAARKCKILNLEKIRLRFNPATKLLTAVCDEPIIVVNKHLGFQIEYELAEFQIEFDEIIMPSEQVSSSESLTEKKPNYKYYPYRTFYLGSSFFRELEESKLSERRKSRRRDKAYELSDMRFFRALAANELEEEGYTIIYKRKQVSPRDHIRVTKLNGATRVGFRHTKYDLLIDGSYQSYLVIDGITIIDDYGTSLRPFSIQFGGYISNIKLSGLLPLDYGL